MTIFSLELENIMENDISRIRVKRDKLITPRNVFMNDDVDSIKFSIISTELH